MAISPTRSREIQLFEPPPDAVYTIEATLAPGERVPSNDSGLLQTSSYLASDRHGRPRLLFDGDAIRALRRIEALRTLCDDDLAGIKIILDLSAALERTRSQIRSLWRRNPRAR